MDLLAVDALSLSDKLKNHIGGFDTRGSHKNMKHVIHVHQQKIKKGEPAIIDRTYKGSRHSKVITITCPCCDEVAATIIQSEEPDSCGARVWIEAESVINPNDL